MAASDPTATTAARTAVIEYEIPLIALAGALVSANEGHEAAYLLVKLVDDRRAAAGLDAPYSTIHRLSLARGHAMRAERSAWVKVREAQTALRAWGWEHGADREVVLGQIEPLYLSEDDKNEIVSLCTEWSASLAGRESGAQAATD